MSLLPESLEPSLYILHEHDEWMKPLRAALRMLGIPFVEWHLGHGCSTSLMDRTPPEGVFYSRISASAHTRQHEKAHSAGKRVLTWLAKHRRIVVNGANALDLELSKWAQYQCLSKHGILTPKTRFVEKEIEETWIQAVSRVVEHWSGPLVSKHDTGGKGFGVCLHADANALKNYVDSLDFNPPSNHRMVIQQRILSPHKRITRAEFIGGKLLYAVDVNTSDGNVELCPADACERPMSPEIKQTVVLDDVHCPTSDDRPALRPDSKRLGQPRFSIANRTLQQEWIKELEQMLTNNDIGVGAIEFIEDEKGQTYCFDINTNTNYNRDAEVRHFGSDDCNYGMHAVAAYLGGLLWHVCDDLAEESLNVAPGSSPAALASDKLFEKLRSLNG